MDDDYLTVTMLSAGLAGILHRRRHAAEGGRNDDGLLPASWRAGFTRLWWRFQAQNVAPLESDLELLALCAHPLSAWPVGLLLSDQDLENCLLVAGELSGFAEQGARLARPDVEAEWMENRVHLALRAAASANGGDDDVLVQTAYAALRRLMIDHPVLTDRDLIPWERKFDRADNSGQTYVRRLVEIAYVARPVHGPQNYLRCPACKNTVPDLVSSCGTPGCGGGAPEHMIARPLAVIYEQHRATRRFVHDPGLVEARIIDALCEESLQGVVRVTPYPGADVLDILIEFLGSDVHGQPAVLETWGVDAKDQVSARLLGRGFVWPATMRCDQQFLALPKHRADQPGYVEDLETELDGRVRGVTVIDEHRLVRRVKATARRICQ
ncbi:hypothetical protein AB0M43_35320 [Longispora sp. NPDC051575]|uniref:restriction endonuclease-related protein n=1 Tax=Longispora sp. NPDC051575 TaxID=3154943 RepID=UPI00341D10E8